jgi:hypothetical protein
MAHDVNIVRRQAATRCDPGGDLASGRNARVDMRAKQASAFIKQVHHQENCEHAKKQREIANDKNQEGRERLEQGGDRR